MSIKSSLAKIVAHIVGISSNKWKSNGIVVQEQCLSDLVRKAKGTKFGIDHDFSNIKNHEDYVKAVPIRDYEALRPYVEKALIGEEDVLWPGKPLYWAKTSGTTSGSKYIPISNDSIGNHINSARNALLAYIKETGNSDFVDGKMIFLSGSPELEEKGGVKCGRLSGIVNHHIPGYLKKNQLPSYETNCIEDWETKLNSIVDETIDQDMTLISGIPPWMQMYFDKIQERSGKLVAEVFPNLQLLVYGGVNYEPYRQKMEQSLGKSIDGIELFPASEGFFAYQDEQGDNGLLLLLKEGIFFEFVPLSKIHDQSPERLTLADVELNVNYAMVVSSNAGLWAYNLGDTIKFVSLDPPKVRVTGRIKHFISAFGEHVIAEEVERAIQVAQSSLGLSIREFHVAPQVNPESGLPHHEWFIESEEHLDLDELAKVLDECLAEQNTYYADLREGSIISRLQIRKTDKGAFNAYMASVGRLGGQNKLPRLANDRTIANFLDGHCKF